MAYDRELANRVREQFAGEEAATETKRQLQIWAHRAGEFTRTLPAKS